MIGKIGKGIVTLCDPNPEAPLRRTTRGVDERAPPQPEEEEGA